MNTVRFSCFSRKNLSQIRRGFIDGVKLRKKKHLFKNEFVAKIQKRPNFANPTQIGLFNNGFMPGLFFTYV